MLQKALQPHLLRRFKRDVLKDLPLRKEVIVRIELTQAQKDLSKKILLRNMETLVDFEKGKYGSTTQISNIYVYMRLIADHPLLLGAEYCTDNFRSKKLCAELNVPFPQTLDDFVLPSAKLQYLNVMLDKILDSHKVLIFSQFKGMANLIGDFLSLKGIKCLKLSGDTPNSSRFQLID